MNDVHSTITGLYETLSILNAIVDSAKDPNSTIKTICNHIEVLIDDIHFKSEAHFHVLYKSNVYSMFNDLTTLAYSIRNDSHILYNFTHEPFAPFYNDERIQNFIKYVESCMEKILLILKVSSTWRYDMSETEMINILKSITNDKKSDDTDTTSIQFVPRCSNCGHILRHFAFQDNENPNRYIVSGHVYDPIRCPSCKRHIVTCTAPDLYSAMETHYDIGSDGILASVKKYI